MKIILILLSLMGLTACSGEVDYADLEQASNFCTKAKSGVRLLEVFPNRNIRVYCLDGSTASLYSNFFFDTINKEVKDED